jgi:hypothetical protein
MMLTKGRPLGRPFCEVGGAFISSTERNREIPSSGDPRLQLFELQNKSVVVGRVTDVDTHANQKQTPV